jgi:hypothetical protein
VTVEKLRRPFLLAAVILVALVVLIEIGSPLAERFLATSEPPGLGVPYLALIDGILLYTLVLIALGLVVPERVLGRVQGCATLILALLLILAGIVLVLAAIALLLLMIGLLASFFGAIVYAALFCCFPRDRAAVVLGLLLTLKLAAGACLVLAQQRFLTNPGLVALVLTSLVANLVVSFLHAFLPGFLTSITDAVAGIIVGIVAIIWAIVLLVFAVVAVLRVIQPPKLPQGAESRLRAPP